MWLQDSEAEDWEMIHKQVLIWKGIPSNWNEFFREVFLLWIETAFVFGVLIALYVNLVVGLL